MHAAPPEVPPAADVQQPSRIVPAAAQQPVGQVDRAPWAQPDDDEQDEVGQQGEEPRGEDGGRGQPARDHGVDGHALQPAQARDQALQRNPGGVEVQASMANS